MAKHSEPADFLTYVGTFARSDEAGSMRGALRAWVGRLSSDAAAADGERREAELPKVATAVENRVSLLRANARAAYGSVEGARSVEGPDAAALEAALDVFETAWRAALADRDDFAEALKAIRLYAPDQRRRALAAASLSTDTPCARGSGYRRYPSSDNFGA